MQDTKKPQARADRDRRSVIVCSACGAVGAHRGHGWCVACYSRWIYHGKPDGGPPSPGALTPKARAPRPRTIPDTCPHDHRLDETNLQFNNRGARTCRACKAEQYQAYRRRRLERLHEGHDLITTVDGRPYCRTCVRGEHDVDEVAVIRAMQGDPPDLLTPAERALAILQLRSNGLTFDLIAQRVGCTLNTAWRVTAKAQHPPTTAAGADNHIRTGENPMLHHWDNPRHREKRTCLRCGLAVTRTREPTAKGDGTFNFTNASYAWLYRVGEERVYAHGLRDLPDCQPPATGTEGG